MVKKLPPMWETLIQLPGKEDPLEKGMATHSSILGWEIPRTEEPGRLLFMGSQRVRIDWVTNTFTFFMLISNSLFIPPTPYFPFGYNKFVFNICFCFVNKFNVSFFKTYSIYEWYHIVFVFLCLTYFTCMIIYRSIHVAAIGLISFFLITE